MTKSTTESQERRRRAHRRTSTESGAALVEAAIAMLLVLTIIGGILDYAQLFGNTIDISSAARLAARTGTSTSTSVVTDDRIIEAVVKKSGADRAGVAKVVVYKATAGSQGPPEPCKTAVTPPPGLRCNVYTPAEFQLSASELATAPSSLNWPASARVAGEDYLGVYIEMQRPRLFGDLVPSPSRYSDYVAMRLDPLSTPASPLPGTGFSTGNTVNAGENGAWCMGASCGSVGGVISAGGSGGSA